MRKLLPVFLLLLAGCTDSLFGPDDEPSITIEVEAESLSETTLLVGERISLTVAFSRRSDSRSVAWRSLDPSVAMVSAEGELAGVAVGETRVIAETAGLSDTILVTVLAAAPVDGQCGGGGGLRLTRGQAYTTLASSLPRLCIQGGTGLEQYIFVPFHAVADGGTLQVEVAMGPPGASMLGSERSPSPVLLPDGEAAPRELLPSTEFDRRLRELEARELGPLVTSRGAGRGPSLALSPAAIPERGETLTLNVNAERTCSSPVHRQVRVAAVSQKAIVLHDVENPAGGFSDSDYASFASSFDNLIYPTIVRHFGEPTDIDGNGRVLIVYTRAVNGMTAGGADAYVAGFFFSRDLFPRSDSEGLRGCSASNGGEILYLMAPDPKGEVNGNVRSREFVMDRTPGVLAHELQHLIGASRRLRILGLDDWNEEFWLNEGMSHIAEELAFYAAAGKAPRQEIQLQNLGLGSVELTRFTQFQITNFTRYSAFLRNPMEWSPIGGENLETRGAAWAFLRYAADRSVVPETDLWRKLIESELVGYENLAGALGVSPLAWLHDWVVALYTDDFVGGVPSRFRQPSWNFRSLVPVFTQNGGVYPLKVHDLVLANPRVALNLAPGAGAITRFSISGGGRTEIRTTSGGEAPPRDLRVTLVRIR